MDERRIGKFFHFNEFDLQANRLGRLSENQSKRLTAAARAEQKSAWDSAMILFGVAAAGLTVGLIVGFLALTLFSRILILLTMGVLWTSAWAGRGLKILRETRALLEPRLVSMSGRIHLKHIDDDYILQVGEKEFDLDGNPSSVIMEGDEYTVYYVEATEEILSLEYFPRKDSNR